MSDIVYVIDSSGTETLHYREEKQLVKALTSVFHVNEKGTHVGVITFGSSAEISIKLGSHSNQSSFDAALERIPFINGLSRIDLGLELALKQFVKQARRDVTHLVVLMTDGGQFGPRPPIGPVAMADTIRRSGIRTVVIGIDSHLNAEMLKMIGGGRWYGSKRKDLMSANFVKKMSKVISSLTSYQ